MNSDVNMQEYLSLQTDDIYLLLYNEIPFPLGAKEKNKNERIDEVKKWVVKNSKKVVKILCKNEKIKKILANGKLVKNTETALLFVELLNDEFGLVASVLITSLVLHRTIEVICDD